MQVNASTPVQTTTPLDGLIADKSPAQSAEAAFAAVLAKAGLNVQAGVSASLQAPVSLSQAIDKPHRAEAKEAARPQNREPEGKAVARGREEDKTTGQARAEEVRPEGKPEARTERNDRSAASEKSASREDTASTGDEEAEPVSAQENAAAEADTGATQETAVPGDQGKSSIVAEVEENVAVAMAAFVAAPVQQGTVQAKTGEAVVAEEAQVVIAQSETGEAAVVSANGKSEQAVTADPRLMIQADESQQEAEQAVEQAIVALGQVGKAVKQTKDESHLQTLEAQSGAGSLKDEQAAMLSRIVGDQGQAKIQVATKGVQTAAQSTSSLAVGLLAAETQTQQAVTSLAAGFGEGADLGSGLTQNNSGQPGNGPAAQATVTAGAQLGANAAVAAQNQTSNFTAALASAQAAAGDGASEIQGVQGTQGPQGAQSAQPGIAQPQQAQDARPATAAQAAEKPHEVKLPIPAKEILDQVNVQISKAAKEGLDKITVQMRPEALGRVEVQLKLGSEGQLSAHIVADRPETLEALKRDASQLERSLADAGFKTDQGSLQFSLRGEQQNNQQQASDSKAPFGFERGQALDEAAAEETIAQSRPRASSRSGVDISV